MTLINYHKADNSRGDNCTFSFWLAGIAKRDDRFANAVCFVSQQAW